MRLAQHRKRTAKGLPTMMMIVVKCELLLLPRLFYMRALLLWTRLYSMLCPY